MNGNPSGWKNDGDLKSAVPVDHETSHVGARAGIFTRLHGNENGRKTLGGPPCSGCPRLYDLWLIMVTKWNICSILFVDDHDDTREAMARLLRLDGYEVETTGNCADTIAFAKQRRFDLLIADLGLPDGNGLELLAQLREIYPIKGIVVSGYGMLDDIDKSNAAGFARHLTKPIDTAELRKAIEETRNDELTDMPRHRPRIQ